MKPGERINAIREIAGSLESYEWADIDLVLGQFGLPTPHSWKGSRNAYVINHLKSTDDGILLELREYLVGKPSENVAETGVRTEEKVWKSSRFKLFISHLTEDKILISEVKERLAAYGIDCFVAHEDIDPTLEWQDVIEAALQSCDALSAFLTNNFHASNWTDQEIGFAVARRVLIIPIKLGINPYGFIGKYQAKNCAKLKSSEIAEEIFSILSENPLTSAKLSEAIVASFVESGSWESARARSLLLSKIKTWTPELLRSIEASLENNGHIPSAWGVPERIKAILTEHRQ